MAGTTDTAAGGGGTGTAPAGGTTPSAGGAAGNGGNGGGTGGVNPGTNAADSTKLDREKLNPLLKGMSEEQVNEVFDTLFSAVRRGPNSGVPEHAQERPRVEPPRPVTKDELREAFDPNSEKFDPQAAIDRIVTQNYGGLLSDIGNRATMGMKMALKSQFPDIDEYEAGINQVLKGRDPATITQQEMVGAYLMAKGAKQVEQEVQARTRKPAVTPPSVQEDPEAREREREESLSKDEEDVARIMFRNSADPVAEFKRTRNLAKNWKIKVPGDK